jgi:hypothetical protein
MLFERDAARDDGVSFGSRSRLSIAATMETSS